MPPPSGALFGSTTAFDTTLSLAGCAGSTWKVTYVNDVSGTTDFVAVGATGETTASIVAGPLPFNDPYAVTLTVTGPSGVPQTTKSQTLFTPKFHD